MNEPADSDPVAVLLASIHPAAPPLEFMERLIASCPGPSTGASKPKIRLFTPRLATAAAAIAVGGTAIWHSFPGAQPQEVVSVPVPVAEAGGAAIRHAAPQHIRQRLLGMRDLGIARDAQSRPVRLMHATWLDQETDRGGPETSPARPTRLRDEIVPVVLTTY